MNTPKIAALYPYYLDAFKHLHTGRSLEDMMSVVQQAQFIQANAGNPSLWVTLRDQDNPAQHFNELGMATDEPLRELVPARVFNWVCAQQPAQPTYPDGRAGLEARLAAWEKEKTGWEAKANEVMPTPMGLPGQPVPVTTDKGRYVVWTGSEQELTVVLRGLLAFRAKRRKHTRRLLAQLWAYHLLQQAPAVAAPAVAAPVAAACAPPSAGLLPRLYGKLRRSLATKAHQLAVAAEAVLGEGAQVA